MVSGKSFCMNRLGRYTIWAAAVLLFFIPVPLSAFVPQGPHVIKLAADSMVEPAGIELRQTAKIYTVWADPAASFEITEKLRYWYPGKFCSKSVYQGHRMMTVVSGEKFVKVIDGRIAARTRSAADHYFDILLYRDRVRLQAALEAAGVDIEKSSLQRYEDRICFTVGALPRKERPASSFWVDKETLLPVRYTVAGNGVLVDTRYRSWRKMSRTWYPMKIEVFLDETLLLAVNADGFELESDFESSVFNVDSVLDRYEKPGETVLGKENADTGTGPGKESDTGVKIFKQLYEHQLDVR